MLNAGRRIIPRLILAAVLSGFGVVSAQEMDDDDDEPVAPVVQQHFMIDDSNFEINTFGNLRTADAARAQFNRFFTLQTDEIERACDLTPAQKGKLLLAARGDMKRFFDRVEEKRKAFQVARTDQQKYQEFFQSLTPIRQAIAKGLFGDGSLFSKTIRSTLDPGQTDRYETILRERELFRQAARLDLVLAVLDTALGLDATQRRRIRTFVREQTRPPKRSSQYDYYVLLIQLARLPEETLKPILHEAQWRTLKTQFDKARQLEPHLTQNDYIPDPAAPVYDPGPKPERPADAKPR